MGTPYKMKGYSYPGESPAKQVKVSLGFGSKANLNLEKKINIKNKGNFNFTGDSKSTTPKYSTTKAAKTQNFRNLASKIKTISSKTNIGSKVVKAGKFLGGKALGVLGMMGAGTLSATATPKGKAKKKGSYTDDFTKLRK